MGLSVLGRGCVCVGTSTQRPSAHVVDITCVYGARGWGDSSSITSNRRAEEQPKAEATLINHSGDVTVHCTHRPALAPHGVHIALGGRQLCPALRIEHLRPGSNYFATDCDSSGL